MGIIRRHTVQYSSCRQDLVPDLLGGRLAAASHGVHPLFPLYYVFVVAGGMFLLGWSLGGLGGVSWGLVLFWLVRGTAFGFLFKRPQWAHLQPAPQPAMIAAE